MTSERERVTRDGYDTKEAEVAPVVDSSMGPTDGVTFFAIGLGCCEWRSARPTPPPGIQRLDPRPFGPRRGYIETRVARLEGHARL